MSQFFISTMLNHEKELIRELTEFWFEMIDLDGLPTRSSLPDCEIVDGGIQIECPDHLGFQINFFSKIASRVLLRIKRFEARYYDQLEKEVKKLDIAKWFLTKNIELKIESHKSRLNNVKNIEEVFIKNLGFANDNNSVTCQKIYVRLFKDQVTISLDTSGEHLHRRGYAEYRGEAPLRETLAALMVRQMHLYTSYNSSQDILLDPFAGSGTLLFESASQYEPNFHRDYAWLHFKICPKLFMSPTWRSNYRWLQQKNTQVLAIDNLETAIINIQKNNDLFGKVFPLSGIDLKTICMNAQDYTKSSQDKKVWILTNPPYGHRMAADNIPQVLQHLEQSVKQLSGIVMIHPLDWKLSFQNFKLRHQIPISNQGLKLNLSVFC